MDRKVSENPEPHCSGAVPPTPRGSQETMSNRRLISSLKTPSLPRNSTPEPPGPPGLVMSVPILASGSVAGRRANDRLTVAPVGSAGSTGTSRELHSRRSPQGSHRSGAGVESVGWDGKEFLDLGDDGIGSVELDVVAGVFDRDELGGR